ncbi:hypothetical protein E2C01_036716 [Portunus trituberculatus]|uniref:Uncharacterized protein n=1 Tax=Portunus trituberculatus TaxID=210409 RepID=A0A5B7FCU5_PORTR|nr:hypothetical protein [Portunus trituberculatus]
MPLLGPLHPLLARLVPECEGTGSRRREEVGESVGVEWEGRKGFGVIDIGMVKGRRNNELSPGSRRDLRGKGMY